MSGLIGLGAGGPLWPRGSGPRSPYVCVGAFLHRASIVSLVGVLAPKIPRLSLRRFTTAQVVQLSTIGWIDWLLASMAFAACLRAAGMRSGLTELAREFFLGQAIGLASLIPGGFGSSDVFWIAQLSLQCTAPRRPRWPPTG